MTHLGPYELDRVHLGDCVELMKALPDEYYVISDPPYNIDFDYGGFRDKLPRREYVERLESVFCDRKCVIIHYPEDTINLLGGGAMGDCSEVVSWIYNSPIPRQHRLITWWNCKPDFSKIPQPYKTPKDHRHKKAVESGRMARSYDWWYCDYIKSPNKEKTAHPCQIPLEVMSRIIKSTTEQGDIILDPFSGSGTTGVAAIQTGRRFLGFEIDPRWVDLANKRIEAAKAQGVLAL